MRKAVNIYQAKSQLSDMVSRAAEGEEFIIAKSGKPRARLVPLAPSRLRRRSGGGKGKVWVADDFDAPLPADLVAALEGR
jgi:prevent-host-death family protein